MVATKVPLIFRIRSFFRNNKFVEWLLEREMNGLFLFFATFIWIDLIWWQRLLISIGVMGVYNFLVQDIKAILRVTK